MSDLEETSRILNNTQHWRNRAEEARVQAEQMNSAEAKRQMLEIAVGYMKLAHHAEERVNAHNKTRATQSDINN